MLKGFTQTSENEAKEQRGGFLGVLLGIQGRSLLDSMLLGKGVIRADEGVFLHAGYLCM